MMTTTKEASLEDLKTRYGTPGDALYLAGIQTIKDHYKNILPISTIQDFLAKSRSYLSITISNKQGPTHTT